MHGSWQASRAGHVSALGHGPLFPR